MLKIMPRLYEQFDADTLRPVNRILSALAVVAVLVLAIEVIFIRSDRQRLLKTISSRVEGSEVRAGLLPKQASSPVLDGSYWSVVSGKNLFAAGVVQKGEADERPASQMILKQLALVGILPGAVPRAILEDKKNKTTFYLSKNESFNGARVKEIKDNTVVLEYEGEKATLTI